MIPLLGVAQDLVRALAELAGQGGAFVRHLFAGSPGMWLALVVADLGAVAALMGWREQRPRRLLYGVLLGVGIAALLAMGDPRALHPSQGLVAVVLAVVFVAHALWLVADELARRLGLRSLQVFCEQVAKNRAAYYLILPSLTLLGIFNYVPAVSVFQTSLYAHDLGGSETWVGLRNYARLLNDAIFWKSMGNLAVFLGCQVALSLTVPLLVAELVFHLRRERSRYWLRTLFLVPIVAPAVVVYLIWQYLYSDAGPVALLGHALGLGHALEGLLSWPQTALAAVILVGFPFVNGINLLIFYAGLSSIPDSVWEAARLDGASSVRRFFTIDLPLLGRQHRLLAVLAVIGAVQAFENVLVMTQGGPGWETMLPGLYMYRSAMSFNEFGYACAVGVVLFLLVLLMSVALGQAFREREGA